MRREAPHGPAPRAKSAPRALARRSWCGRREGLRSPAHAGCEAERPLLPPSGSPPGVDARLGALLCRRGAKVDDLVSKLDGANSGHVRRQQLIEMLKTLGLAATAEECDALVDTFDAGVQVTGSGGAALTCSALS